MRPSCWRRENLDRWVPRFSDTPATCRAGLGGWVDRDDCLSTSLSRFAHTMNSAAPAGPHFRSPNGSMSKRVSLQYATLPGLTGKVPAVIDARGNAVKRPTNELGGANPFPASSVDRDPVLNEMARLGISTATPPTSIKYRGKPTTLSASETQRLAEDEGRDMHNRLARLMSSSGWSGTPDAIKRTRITEMRREVDQNRAFRLARMRDHN
jgi:hypothetical protein